MKLELHFNESTYRKQMELLYDFGFGKKLKYYKNSHYFGFALFFIGLWSILDKRNFGYALLLFALGILIPYFVFYFKHKRVSKRLAPEQEEIVSIYTKNPKVVLEFSETEFKFTDYDSERIIVWDEFLTFRIMEENLFLFTKKHEPYVIGKYETGEEKYNQILQIVESKLKR